MVCILYTCMFVCACKCILCMFVCMRVIERERERLLVISDEKSDTQFFPK